MNRTTWLQDRRMAKFCDVLSRWTRRELSALDASQILGCSERQFRRILDAANSQRSARTAAGVTSPFCPPQVTRR